MTAVESKLRRYSCGFIAIGLVFVGLGFLLPEVSWAPKFKWVLVLYASTAVLGIATGASEVLFQEPKRLAPYLYLVATLNALYYLTLPGVSLALQDVVLSLVVGALGVIIYFFMAIFTTFTLGVISIPNRK